MEPQSLGLRMQIYSLPSGRRLNTLQPAMLTHSMKCLLSLITALIGVAWRGSRLLSVAVLALEFDQDV